MEAILKKLNASSNEIRLSMVVTVDGLVMAHSGEAEDADLFGAYFAELKLVCESIVGNLHCGDLENIMIRSSDGYVNLWPIFDKGYLACMSSPSVNVSRLELSVWATVRKLYEKLSS